MGSLSVWRGTRQKISANAIEMNWTVAEMYATDLLPVHSKGWLHVDRSCGQKVELLLQGIQALQRTMILVEFSSQLGYF